MYYAASDVNNADIESFISKPTAIGSARTAGGLIHSSKIYLTPNHSCQSLPATMLIVSLNWLMKSSNLIKFHRPHHKPVTLEYQPIARSLGTAQNNKYGTFADKVTHASYVKSTCQNANNPAIDSAHRATAAVPNTTNAAHVSSQKVGGGSSMVAIPQPTSSSYKGRKLISYEPVYAFRVVKHYSPSQPSSNSKMYH